MDGKATVELLLETISRVRKVISVNPEDSVLRAAQVLKENNVGLIIVLEDEKLVGVVSERDIVQRWVASTNFPTQLSVCDVMSRDVETVLPTDTVHDCYLRFIARRCRHLPVVLPTGAVIGILSLRDVTAYVVNRLSERSWGY